MFTRKAPTNTEQEAKANPLGTLAQLWSPAGPSAGIEWMEAQGQRELVSSTTLPTQWVGEGRTVLREAGVKFLEEVPGDPLFTYVELPKGWTKTATAHSMHSDLRDKKGRKRAGIFYKAAFYDRAASGHTVSRYSIDSYGTDTSDVPESITAAVKDGDGVIYTTPPRLNATQGMRYSVEVQDLRAEAEADAVTWLSEHYPEWRDHAAYWD